MWDMLSEDYTTPCSSRRTTLAARWMGRGSRGEVHKWRGPVAKYERRLWPGGRTLWSSSACTSRLCYSSALLEEMACVAGDDGNMDASGGGGGRLWFLIDLTTCGRTC